MRCPVCESRVKPIAKRPSALPRSLAFNQVIGVELVEFDDLGIQLTLLNVVCWGTGYQMMSIIPDNRSETVRNAFSKDKIHHYGWPELAVTDQGPEFIGHEFVDYVAEGACLHHFIDSKLVSKFSLCWKPEVQVFSFGNREYGRRRLEIGKRGHGNVRNRQKLFGRVFRI